MGTELFKTHDIRTKEENLTQEVMNQLLDAVVSFYTQQYGITKIVIGKDARLMAPVLAEKAIEKFSQAGVEVLTNPRPVSTCQFYYTCMKNSGCAGLMFTASHNPKQYIGIKLIAPGIIPISMGSGLEKIKEFYTKKVSFTKAPVSAQIHHIDETENYIKYCMELSGVHEGSLKGMKILFEFLCGSAGYEVIRAFEKAGAEVTARNAEPDGNFPAGDPNPLIESSVAPSREAMRNGTFELGYCFDGDGDRMDIMAKDGEQIPPSVNACMLMPELLKIFKGRKKDFYVDMKAIPTAVAKMNECGASTHLICNGHAFIKRKLRENCSEGYMGAVEESAHYYLNFPYDKNDFEKGFASVEFTLFFALLSAKCYRENPEKYRTAVEMRDCVFRVREWTVHFENAPEKMVCLMNEIKEKMRSLGAEVTDKMEDGSDLQADLMRIGLPAVIKDSTDFAEKWVQVAQRISASEDTLCRFEITSNDSDECMKINSIVRQIADGYVK